MQPRNTKKTIKEIVKYLLFLSITVVLLYFSFKDISFGELVDGLKSANLWWIAASMIAGYAAFLIRARRWQFIIEPLGYKPSFKNTYDAVMLTYLANFAMPRMGEVVRCGALRKTEKIPFESLLGTVVLERVFDMVCLIVISLSVILLRMDTFGNFLNENVWQPLLARTTGGSYVFLYILLAVFIVLLIALVIFWNYIKKWPFVDKVVKVWKGLLDGLKSGFRLQRRSEFLVYTVLIWFIYWLQGYTVMMAMPETAHLGVIDALFLMIVGGLGWVAPVQGGMGAYHIMVSLALSAMYGIPKDHGVVFATISHETQAIIMIVFGLISWALVMLVSKKTAKTVQENVATN